MGSIVGTNRGFLRRATSGRRRVSARSMPRVIDTASVDATLIERVVERWRGATMGNRHRLGTTTQDHGTPTPETGSTTPLEAERSLLRAAAPSIASGKAPPVTPARQDSDLRARLLRK